MATTPNYGIPYPDDYEDPADSPAMAQNLAVAVDTAMLDMEGRITSKATVYVQTAEPVAPRVGDIWAQV